jgi:diacylglycerol kinase
MSKISFVTSVKCAVKGVFYGISHQRMLKILLLLGMFAIFSSLLLQVSKPYLITILIVSFLVIILELFNNNFERLIDLISPEYHKEFGEIKDTMAGVVLLSFILMVIVASLILYEPMIKLFSLVSTSPLPFILIIFNIFLILFILLYKKNTN